MHTSIEIAYPTGGEPFNVEVISNKFSPPIIRCDGAGIDCPFQKQFHGATVCDLVVPGAKSQNLLCGKPFPFIQDEEDDS